MFVGLIKVGLWQSNDMPNGSFTPIDLEFNEVVLTGVELLLRVADNHNFPHVVIGCQIHRRFLFTVLDPNRAPVLN
jgi:hypothetical protein